jgi:hypothetical protein
VRGWRRNGGIAAVDQVPVFLGSHGDEAFDDGQQVGQ